MPAPDRPPRIGLIGCGNCGQHVLLDLMTCGCEVEVVAASPESVENARGGNATRITARVADLSPADVVIVVTPATTHVEVIDEILERRTAEGLYCGGLECRLFPKTRDARHHLRHHQRLLPV